MMLKVIVDEIERDEDALDQVHLGGARVALRIV
jgi:hypothetical protein